jgi:hypothetical protein
LENLNLFLFGFYFFCCFLQVRVEDYSIVGGGRKGSEIFWRDFKMEKVGQNCGGSAKLEIRNMFQAEQNNYSGNDLEFYKYLRINQHRTILW